MSKRKTFHKVYKSILQCIVISKAGSVNIIGSHDKQFHVYQLQNYMNIQIFLLSLIIEYMIYLL